MQPYILKQLLVLPRKYVTQHIGDKWDPTQPHALDNISPEQLTVIIFTEKAFHHVLLHGTFTLQMSFGGSL